MYIREHNNIVSLRCKMVLGQLVQTGVQFNQMGSVTKDLHSNYSIGSIPTIGGPFTNAANCYRAWSILQSTCKSNRGRKRDVFPERVAVIDWGN
jgi:hypothetical protein